MVNVAVQIASIQKTDRQLSLKKNNMHYLSMLLLNNTILACRIRIQLLKINAMFMKMCTKDTFIKLMTPVTLENLIFVLKRFYTKFWKL